MRIRFLTLLLCRTIHLRRSCFVILYFKWSSSMLKEADQKQWSVAACVRPINLSFQQHFPLTASTVDVFMLSNFDTGFQWYTLAAFFLRDNLSHLRENYLWLYVFIIIWRSIGVTHCALNRLIKMNLHLFSKVLLINAICHPPTSPQRNKASKSLLASLGYYY